MNEDNLKTIRCKNCGKQYRYSGAYRKEGRATECESCRSRRKSRANYFYTKNKIVEYLGGKCQKCGYNKCLAALVAHHVNPNSKNIGMANHTRRNLWYDIVKELNKCILLCQNCHNELHYKELHKDELE
jgi:Zn ribbon nucleic-acid-binding protein